MSNNDSTLKIGALALISNPAFFIATCACTVLTTGIKAGRHSCGWTRRARLVRRTVR